MPFGLRQDEKFDAGSCFQGSNHSQILGFGLRRVMVFTDFYHGKPPFLHVHLGGYVFVLFSKHLPRANLRIWQGMNLNTNCDSSFPSFHTKKETASSCLCKPKFVSCCSLIFVWFLVKLLPFCSMYPTIMPGPSAAGRQRRSFGGAVIGSSTRHVTLDRKLKSCQPAGRNSQGFKWLHDRTMDDLVYFPGRSSVDCWMFVFFFGSSIASLIDTLTKSWVSWRPFVIYKYWNPQS